MHRDLVLIALIIVVVFTSSRYAEGKICPSVDMRNGVRSMEKLRNCTIIMGNLTFVLMDKVNDSSVFDDYSFPELTEIVDFMLVFRIPKLVSLGKLFPNLKLIRGRKLFLGYALVIYRVQDLQEIGLTNLQHIGRGAVKVDNCPKLCYVRTIDWKRLGASTLDYPAPKTSICKDEFCPNECAGYCWNNYNCQKRTLDYCPNFDDEGKCVLACPASKVTNRETMKCMTPAECVSTLNGTWWVFNGSCVNSCPILYDRDDKVEGGCRYLGETYSRKCSGAIVDSLDALEKFIGCTHVVGYLDIRISGNMVVYLEEYLGNIVSISQYLKIGRSKPIQSLEFLKNLTVIKGEKLDNNRALFVFENENLKKLWDFDDNFKLTIVTGTMAFHNNPQLCLSEIEKLENAKGITVKADMQISQYSNGYKSVCNQKEMKITFLERSPTNVTLKWDRLSASKGEMVIGYTIYYITTELSAIMSENEDTCDRNSWEGIFVRENQMQLRNLVPYTSYSYYIKTYTTLHQGEQTPLYSFSTTSSEPSEPMEIEAKATTDTTIVLTWDRPVYRNGIASHYTIVMYRELDHLPTIKQRDYCDHPHILEFEETVVPTNASVNATNNCTCPEQTFRDVITKDVTCSKMEHCIKSIYQQHPFFARELPTDIQREEIPMNAPDRREYIVPDNQTEYEFTDLKHYSLYLFYVQACNVRETGGFDCGNAVFASQRTKKRDNADVIRNLKIDVDDPNADVRWQKPEEWNSVLVAYQIEYKRTDAEHSKLRFECITHDQYEELGHRYKMFDLTPGKYSIRVQAISLAGPGTFSDWQDFEITAEGASIFEIIGPTLGFMVVAVIIVAAYWWYRRRRARDNHLITSINPDYSGPVYIEDHWEIERSDIRIIRELGQGSFGMVYEGLIVSRNCPCAVKTASDGCPVTSRMHFLNEGAVMKTFQDAHHVIKLLGIVSRGTPPLVIMELMERGDLKSYLRRTRDSSQNVTSNEMYRMAAQIADGMAYLSVKKFVHRDLAARNCMIGADYTVKIGDFGMARDIYETDYYRKDTAGLLPVRWMAPESLADGVFTSDSDVWSYGVVLWEMATLAEQPYQGYSNEDVFKRVKRGLRLDRPAECSDDFYEVMNACWKWRPIDRPTFVQIVRRLLGHVGADFQLVSFVCSQRCQDLINHGPPRVVNPPAMIPQLLEEEDYAAYAAHYDLQDEGEGDNVRLYRRERSPNRPARYLPLENQRSRSPYHVRPGSPASSHFSFDDDSS